MSPAVAYVSRAPRLKNSSADALRSVAGSDRSVTGFQQAHLPAISSVRVKKAGESWPDIAHRIGYLFEHEQSDAALALCRDALSTFRAAYGASQIKALPSLRALAVCASPDYAIQIKNYCAGCSLAAQILSATGKLPEATAMWRECLEIALRPQFPHPMGAASISIELALGLATSAREEERQEARHVFKNGLRIFQRIIHSSAPAQSEASTQQKVAEQLLVSALRSAATTSRSLHDQESELLCAKGALRAAERLLGKESIETAEVRAELAEILAVREDLQGALLLLRRSIDLVPNAATSSEPKILYWYAKIAETLLSMDDGDEAQEIAAQTMQRLTQSPETESAFSSAAIAHRVVGICKLKEGDPEKAREHFDSALDFLQRGSRIDAYSLVEAFQYSSLAIVQIAKTDTTPGGKGASKRAALYEEAEERHFAAIHFVSQTALAQRELDVIAHENYFDFLARIGRADEQLSQAVKLVKLSAKAFGEQSSGHIDALMRAAQAFEAQEQYGKAEALAQQAVDVAKRLTADSSQIPLTLFRELSHLLRAGGASAAAVDKLAEALALSKQRSGEDSIQTAQTKVELAYAHIANGAYDTAKTLLDEALPCLEEFGAHLPLDTLARAYHYRGLSEIRVGGEVAQEQFDLAMRYFQLAEEQFERLEDSESLGFADLKADLGRTLAALAERTGDSNARSAAIAALRACDDVYRQKRLDKSPDHFELLRHLLELLEETEADDLDSYRSRVESMRLLFEDLKDDEE